MLSPRSLLVIFLFFITAPGCGQSTTSYTPVIDSLQFSLGDTSFTVLRYRYDTSSQPFIVHVHANEQTADSAAKEILAQHGGIYLTIINNRKRLLTFPVAGARHSIDPNRMFTARGRKESFETYGTYSAVADSAAAVFGSAFLLLVPGGGPIVAMHNNTPDLYSIASYLPGGVFEKEAAIVYQNGKMDTDDFVLTTDTAVFSMTKNEGINTILHNNKTATDDGSLGYYFGRMGIAYTNIEAQHNHRTEQILMTKKLFAHLRRYRDQ